MWAFVALFFGIVARAAAAGDYGPEALQDEIHNLPGAPTVSWRSFSGYIDVSSPGEKAGTRQMFYWFVESQNKPETDPVLLWTNGGPGCTGLGGFLSEQGPFRAGKGGTVLEVNEHAWTKLANMVFIEQPVGVGFSKAATKIDYGDEQAAADNHRFIVGFFKRFSQYASQSFYISSESYGGHYLPTLAKKIKEKNDVNQFRGVFLGNPLTYMQYRNYGQYGTAWGHQLFSAPLWKQYEEAECAKTFPPSDTCGRITDSMDRILASFDPYALDYDKCNTQAGVGRAERWALRNVISRANARNLTQLEAVPYEPCIEDFMTAYLNRADVQQAIHVKAGAKWSMCSNDVGNAYNMTDVNTNMVPVWKELIEMGDMNIMIVSGDDDTVCATLGTQQFIWDMGYNAKSTENWKPWMVDGQTAGFRTDFDVPIRGAACQVFPCGFSFATVHSAGHMIPATQPARSLALLKSFLGPPPQGKAVVV